MNEKTVAVADSSTFNWRMGKWSRYGEHVAFLLSAVYGAREKILSLKGSGTQVVAVRTGEYRTFDPETLQVDEVAEGYFLRRIQERYGNDVGILSEELGSRVPKSGIPPYYFVSDPFDGSKLYRRGNKAFWYTTLATYSGEGTPLGAAVCNILTGEVDFAGENKAFTGQFVNDELADVKQLMPKSAPNLEKAVLETYLMNPARLYPASEIWKPLFQRVGFIVPNGGPAGFTDVARGVVDMYLALQEAHTENFSALPIAWAAGLKVTDFAGQPVRFETDINKQYFLLCTGSPVLHQQVLNIIGEIDWQSAYTIKG